MTEVVRGMVISQQSWVNTLPAIHFHICPAMWRAPARHRKNTAAVGGPAARLTLSDNISQKVRCSDIELLRDAPMVELTIPNAGWLPAATVRFVGFTE